MDTNTLYMEHYVDLHNYISDNIYELDENCIFENGIGDLLKKTVEGGKNAVKWLCTTIQKLWHFITKWFTGTQRRERQKKLKDLMSGSKKEEIARKDPEDISKAISEIYKNNKKYHLLDLNNKDFAVITEEILKYCRANDSFLEFYLEPEDFEKLHKIIKILDKFSDVLVYRDENETIKDAISFNDFHIQLIDIHLDSKNYKGFKKFIKDLLLNAGDTILIKGFSSFLTFASKMAKIKPTEIDDDVIKDIKIEIKNSDKITDKTNTIKYIDLLKNIKTIQKFFIHYIKMLDLLIDSIRKVCNITDAEIVTKEKESWIARLFSGFRISKTVKNYIKNKDKISVRMVLKDSLLLDKTFKDFDIISEYAIKHGIPDLYDKHNGEKFKDESEWDEEYLDEQEITLDLNFSKERIELLKKIINKLYNIQITDAFKEAVKEKDKTLVRIALKDSLLIDKSFKDFDIMSEYAIKNGISDLYDKHNGKKFLDESQWTEDYLNEEKIQVVKNFSKERIELLKNIIRKIYGNKK